MITKDIVLANGFTASHWRLTSRHFNDLVGTVNLIVKGWKDQAAFDAGREPAKIIEREVGGAQYTFLANKSVAQTEAAIVANVEFFAGGVVS